jgi:hypothetical protein
MNEQDFAIHLVLLGGAVFAVIAALIERYKK